MHETVSPTFEKVYAETFSVVWRMVRRMGVAYSSVDDLVQEVYIIVHRKLEDFTGTSSAKTWVLAITLGVVRNYRRTLRRKGAGRASAAIVDDPELLRDPSPDPFERLSRSEAGELVQRLLDELDDEKATVFVLVELEGLTIPEVASVLSLNIQTAYSRLATARREFEQSVRRFHRFGEHPRAASSDNRHGFDEGLTAVERLELDVTTVLLDD